MSDLSELLRLALRSGDREAWNDIVRSEAGRLRGIAWAITRDDGLADDVVQETFLRLVEGRIDDVGRGAASALLGSITARAAIDATRRREARRRREEAYGMARPEAAQDDRPEKRVLDAELRAGVDEGLALLDPVTRAAIWLHVVEGQGVREVARSIEAPKSTAADRIRSGLSRLEEHLRLRGLALGAGISWASLLARTAPEGPSPELAGRLLALGERLGSARAPQMPPRAGPATSAKAAAAACVLLAAGTLAVLLAPRPGEDPAPMARAPELPIREVTLAAAPAGRPPAAAPSKEEAAPEPVDGFRLAGTVYDVETRLPIAGAAVRPEKEGTPRPPGTRWEASSGLDGEFELVLPADVNEAFTAEAAGYSACRIHLRNDREEGGLHFPLLPKLEVSGQVVGEEGDPLEGATIEVQGVTQGKRTSFPSDGSERTTTGPDGRFTIILPELGQARLSVLHAGYGGVLHHGAAPGERDIAIVVPRGSRVAGAVVDGPGSPAAGARIRWYADFPWNTGWKGQLVADAGGRFEIVLPSPAAHFVHLEDGRLDSTAIEEAVKAGSRFAERVAVAPGGDPPEVLLDLGSLRDWKAAKASGENAATEAPRRTRPTSRPREAPAKVVRVPMVRVRGLVLDPGGRPVPSARAYVVLAQPYFRWHLHAVSGGDGRFEAKGHERAGEFEATLLVTHRSWAEKRVNMGKITFAERDPEAAPEDEEIPFADLEVRLETGFALTGRLADASGAAVSGALVLGRDPKGTEDLRLLAKTGADGSFRIEHHPVQEPIALTFSHAEFAPHRLERDPGAAGEGGSAGLGTIVLARGGAVEGFVLQADGTPASWRVVIHEGPWLTRSARTDGAGRFRLEHVPAGTSRIAVLKSHETMALLSHAIQPAEEVEIAEGVTTRRDVRLAE